MNNNKNHVISDVCKGSPADIAGLKAGDIFISLNGEEIEDIFDYRYKILVPHIDLTVLRGEEEVSFLLTRMKTKIWVLNLKTDSWTNTEGARITVFSAS